MKRLIFASLSTIALHAAFASGAFAKPPSGDANPSDLANRTVDTSQIIAPTTKQTPPSGDANPSDLFNRTVDTSRVINPHIK